ncbi:BTAD domain-containing putative transcriptional regulator [Streptomyces sp. NPDC012888]|uniref:AfsR/SARP family transcriptional regulator n=1 Tax=Streptomyces sp. NPDC012888 TaxID=3364855 RepID=UPI0036AF18BB
MADARWAADIRRESERPAGDWGARPGAVGAGRPRLNILGEDGIHFAGRQSERMAPRAAELLAFVHLSHRQEVRRPAVLRALWPEEEPRTARRRLSRLLWRCGHVLPPGLLTVDGESIALDRTLDSDHQGAQAAIDRILAGETPGEFDIRILHRRLLTDVTAEWTEEHRSYYDRRRTRALEKATEMLLRRNQAAPALLHAAFLSEWQPLNENARQLLFRALLMDGAPGRALEVFRAYQHTLRKELGAEPGAEFRDMARNAELGSRRPTLVCR